MVKNIVICSMGKQNVTNLWLHDKRNFDVFLIDYTETLKPYEKDGVRLISKKGFKYPLSKYVIQQYHLLKKYDNFIFLDDDIVVTSKQLNDIFETSIKFGFDISHPCVKPDNMPHTSLMKQDKYCSFRVTNWSEIQCIYMNKKTCESLLNTFNENNSGYGLPDIWDSLGYEFVILDEIEVMHPLPMGRDGNSNIKLDKALDEYKTVLKKYNLQKREEKTEKFIKNIISFVVIYSKEKAHYLPEMMSTIPPDSEVVLVETIPLELNTIPIQDIEKIDKITDIEKSEDGLRVHAKYYYINWNYANARNAAKSLATKPVIFSLDSDERLLTHQHNMILKEALDLHYSDFLGVSTNTLSVNRHINNGKGLNQVSHNTRVSMFKNIPELYWTGCCHETIDRRINDLEKRYKDSAIKIDHVGYDIQPEKMKDKALNRIWIYLNNAEDLKDSFNFDKFIQECANFKIFKDAINKEKGI